MDHQLLAGAAERIGRPGVDRLGVEDNVLTRLDLDVAVALDLHELVGRIEHDLVLLRLVDDGDLLGTILVVEDQAMPAARLDQLGVVLPRLIGLDRLLFGAPDRANHDRPIDVTVLEHDHHLVVLLRQYVGAALITGHRDRDARPERLLTGIEPLELQLEAVARIVGRRILVIDDRADVQTAHLVRALRQGHGAIDRQERHLGHAMLMVEAS
jgi:hypothetical protein